MALTGNITSSGGYRSLLNGKFHSFPYYDEESKSVKYHPAEIAKFYKTWYQDGDYHSYNDEPAVIFSNGNKEWYKNGKLHRDGDKPAAIFINGETVYY